MKPDIWMPFYIGDYLRDTMHLTLEQHGAYCLLIFHYWVHGPIPDDDSLLQTLLHSLSQPLWTEHKKVLMKFFNLKDGRWYHKRIDVELARAKELQDKNRRKTEAARRARSSVTDTVTVDVTNNVTVVQSQSHVPPPPILNSTVQTENGYPTEETCLKWLAGVRACGADYREIEVKNAFLSLRAVGWKIGKNQATDWRAALEMRIQDQRSRIQNKPRNKGANL